ncbi:hypothetical protein EGT74_01505 [Chitinophaga lutea]|uniref:Lipoprotein n=1 Tax=Chitinophaga lutea TaxID=2488634 RepID=A0A3N4Q8C4_9BACT|nr:hypothetical protein EGT74_01505 [Chitinophaga lutea]
MDKGVFWKIKSNAFFLLYMFSLLCSACEKRSCPKNAIVVGARYLNGDSVLNEKSYFIFYDSTQLDYLDGRLVAKYDIRWNGCSSYSLIIKSLENPGLLNVGDTLNISILSNTNDTFHYLMRFKERKAVAYFLKKQK